VTAAAPAPPPLDDGLEQLLRRMRLPHMRRIAPEVIATAKAQRWDPAEVLRALLAEEVAGRDRSSLATRRARAAFPTGKTFDAWDERLSSVPAPTQAALRTLEWIARRENLIVCGPSGTGKTFMLEALGQAAVAAGKNVAWFTWSRSAPWSAGTGPTTRSPRPSPGSCGPTSSSSTTSGSCPLPPTAAEGLYQIVDAAYERRSVAVSSNLHPSGFDELMPKTLATASVDRLMHHAHVCQTSGDSIRLTQAIAGKGVIPLS
jgi:DNA replication protein DnaC